jgi:hypothetical protein
MKCIGGRNQTCGAVAMGTKEAALLGNPSIRSAHTCPFREHEIWTPRHAEFPIRKDGRQREIAATGGIPFRLAHSYIHATSQTGSRVQTG